MPDEEEYEILPHQEIEELREELSRLKEIPTQKGLQASLIEVSHKLDLMMDVFREAQETIKVEEGSLSMQEKLAPIMERLDKVLEQNSQIAEGIVALADLVKKKQASAELFTEGGGFALEEKSKEVPKQKPKPLPRGPLPPPPPFKPPKKRSLFGR